ATGFGSFMMKFAPIPTEKHPYGWPYGQIPHIRPFGMTNLPGCSLIRTRYPTKCMADSSHKTVRNDELAGLFVDPNPIPDQVYAGFLEETAFGMTNLVGLFIHVYNCYV